ncbi:spexin isoform X2 [Bubalus bubalis]|uniref:spexin isoform X2 n=1 Tax=Bubalus bubalis TaxID=89462 RepID=UPI001E1B63E7|nr:spexin isoform X2 [Bubalus bubalis]
MKGFKSLVVMTLTLFLVFSFMGNCNSAPQRLFERRNWTPQAMLYLKGARMFQTLCSSDSGKGRALGAHESVGQMETCGERILSRGAPLPFRPEPEEGPLRPAAAGKTKPKFPTTNSSRGSSCTIGFFAETTRRYKHSELFYLQDREALSALEILC